MENEYHVVVTKWLSSKVFISTCMTLGNLEREVHAHDQRVGETTIVLTRIKITKGQLSTFTNSYDSLTIICIR